MNLLPGAQRTDRLLVAAGARGRELGTKATLTVTERATRKIGKREHEVRRRGSHVENCCSEGERRGGVHLLRDRWSRGYLAGVAGAVGDLTAGPASATVAIR